MINIYLITNQINGKTYVGQTERTLATRFREHRNSGRKGIGVAIQQHKPENFTIELLETTTTELADDRETYWIKETNSYGAGYNLCETGDSSQSSKQPEVKELIREAARRRVEDGWVSPTTGGHTEEAKRRMRGPRPNTSKSQTGRVQSEETRQKIRDAQIKYHERRRRGLT